ncbi:hypothetical protein N8Y73_23270 [Enterobacter hormaechei subsp. steigerwaltii]|nr:hypothetical protein [Enterobacter hormaechei subsp. steigerwaltii]
MSTITIVFDNELKIKVLKSNEKANYSLTLFYGTSSENPEISLDSYVNDLKEKGVRVFDICDLEGYMNCRLGHNDYIRIKSEYSSSIYDEQSALLASKVLLCADNVVATIHAVTAQDALKRLLSLLPDEFDKSVKDYKDTLQNL